MTLSELFGLAHDCPPRGGAERCLFCGAACDDSYPSSTFLKSTCSYHDILAAPGSPYVCAGCIMTREERAIFPDYEKPQKIRNHSWVVTAAEARHYSKAAIDEIRAACLNPPEPPFGIVIAVSGQKQLLYRGRVNGTRETVDLLLEEERVIYRPADLADRLALARRIVAATGKPALSSPPGFSLYRAAFEYLGEIETAEEWARCWNEPLSRLAAFLSPRKEICRGELEAAS